MKAKITIFYLELSPKMGEGLSKSEVTDIIKKEYLPKIIQGSFGLKTDDYKIVRNEHGKPLLKTNSGTDAHISISHTEGMWICATASLSIGIDIERIKSGRRNVAERYFHHDEKELLNTYNNDEQYNRTFFTLWTAKEAYGKLLGSGVNSEILGTQVGTKANITHRSLADNHILAIATPLLVQSYIEFINLATL